MLYKPMRDLYEVCGLRTAREFSNDLAVATGCIKKYIPRCWQHEQVANQINALHMTLETLIRGVGW
jgi:hypothetical protein